MAIGIKELTQPAGEPYTLDEAKIALRIAPDNTIEDGFLMGLIRRARKYLEDIHGQALISRSILVTYDRMPQHSPLFWPSSRYTGQFRMHDARTPTATISAQDWLDRSAIRIPRSPLQAVTSIKYTDLTNTLQTLDPTLYRVDCMSDPGTVIPAYNQIWPWIHEQTQAIKIQAVVGYGPSTTVALAIAAGTQTVTPASTFGVYAQSLSVDPVYPGTVLAIDTGANREFVTVTATTGATFTATFVLPHSAGTAVIGGIPETIQAQIEMLVAHWYQNREPVGSGAEKLPLAFDTLRWASWNGELT